MTIVRVQFGGRSGEVHDLETNEDLVAVRTRDGAPVEEVKRALSGRSRSALERLEPIATYQDAGVEVFHVRSGAQSDRDLVRKVLKAEPVIKFAGRVLADPVFKPAQGVMAVEPGAPTKKEPVLYSENLFVKFEGTVKASQARQILGARNLEVKRAITYVPNGFFVKAPDGIGLDVFPLALDLLRKDDGVELCHPELLRRRQLRAAFPRQWHLARATLNGVSVDAHASVVAAWKKSRGAGIVIAIIDEGIDIDHEEFKSKGKIVHPHDATEGALDSSDPRPIDVKENHGTACAGVACANGKKGASGVAPSAKLMPIRLYSALGSQGEADAFAWAADHGADVISCSWGPPDGHWWDPTDAHHRAKVRLGDNTRLAMEYAIANGRGGKGCVVCFAAGNGNESVDNDGYASHPGVIAVAACNDTGKRSVYSDTGKALWCAFPSSDFDLDKVSPLPAPKPEGGVWNKDHPKPITTGIWTTDRMETPGYNRGGPTAGGDAKGNYTNSFGGTSSAAPGVAGVAALVLARNKKLRQEEVREILKRSCEQIDTANGKYDATTGHSNLYGFGRVNAALAVDLAKPASPAGPKGKGKAKPARKKGAKKAKQGAKKAKRRA